MMLKCYFASGHYTHVFTSQPVSAAAPGHCRPSALGPTVLANRTDTAATFHNDIADPAALAAFHARVSRCSNSNYRGHVDKFTETKGDERRELNMDTSS
ncbi:hypothetical protein JYU34_002056 [Plutella xylostella]|uniref:Uncharacterized protein n=1 Tax=Plutella xylostella TaxID=51655 RepID=A0ABQ7R5E4_PLUXY|nr:hypothetical protein JYU34_002056 [Plutella xylostella]